MAKEVLSHPVMRGAAEAARSMRPTRVLVIGHSYTLTIHFSTPASFTITAAEVLRSLGAPVEWRQLGEGGLSAERARERYLAEGLAAKPDFTLIVTVLKTDADYEALRAMAAALRAQGSRVAVLDRVHPDTSFWANADSAKLRAVAGATGIEILEVGALVDSDPARGEFISLDGIHTTGPHHRLLARELVRLLLGMRGAGLGGG
jgi:hypothetical protein